MKLSVIQHFDERADSYDRAEWVRNADVLRSLVEYMELAPGRRILDLGAGTGVVLGAALAACPGLGECVALDISTAMLARIDDPRIRTVCHDAESLPFADASFDVVVCRQVLHYLDNLDSCLREVHRVLADSGVLVIGQGTPFGPDDEQWWKLIVKARQPLRRHFLTVPELQVLLKRNAFSVVKSSQARTAESLNGWLSRYERSAEQIELVRCLHDEAPQAYTQIHRFRLIDGDTRVDNCWTFIQARKTRLHGGEPPAIV